MKLAGTILALAAVAIALPALSNAQASRPGPPTPIVQASAEKSDDEVCGLQTLRGTYTFAARGFNIVAGIAQPNPASYALHQRFGFRAIGTLSEVGRKFEKYWDVLWLERPLKLPGA
jgi:phosphinothricin acetyltransferase